MMTFKPPVLALGIIFVLVASTANAQQPSGGRRTELEYLDRGFDLEGITAPTHRPDFWHTPEGRALYERQQMERFEKNLHELIELARRDWLAGYDSRQDRRAGGDFSRSAQDLERVSGELISFFEWRFELEPLTVEESAAEPRERAATVAPMVEQILDTITALSGGGIPAAAFVEMRVNLAQIHALSRSLRN